MSELLSATLVELTNSLRELRASPVELMQAVLSQVEETRDSLNAVVALRSGDTLLDEARAAERRLVAGQGRALEGIPFAVKDLEDAEGLVTSRGSVPFRERIAARDSIQVERLKRAGAIVLGKTNAPEFGHTAITKNFVYGVTRSPWDPERTPGGSSGGAAAALAGEVVPLVTASDGGGSVRIPASFVGAFGLKTSFGRIPHGPDERWPVIMTVVHGPLTKCVEDAALILDQVVGYDLRDPTSLPHPGSRYVDRIREALPDRLRIGFAADFGDLVVQSDVAAVVEDAARTFERLGHSLSRVPDGPPDMTVEWGLLSALDIGTQIEELVPERAPDFTQSMLRLVRASEELKGHFWHDFARKRAALAAWCADVFERFDLLLTPTVPYDPPPVRGPFPSELEGRTLGIASVAGFCIPFNLSWNPAASVRAGFSRAGLPVGLQIVAPHHREDLLLRAARAFERERPWAHDWPRRH
jgi:aspartyl-tRNA(Asn)/glutamyl-tRNA(Gln) amidotransferase subunit A